MVSAPIVLRMQALTSEGPALAMPQTRPLMVTTRVIRPHLGRSYNFYNRFAILLQVLCGLPSNGRARLTRMLCAAVNENYASLWPSPATGDRRTS